MFKWLWYSVCTPCRAEQNSTVRYAFPLMAIAAITAGTLAAVIAGDVSYLKISASPATIKSGETLTLTVTAVASTPINAVDVSLRLPQQQMKLIGIDTGNSVITLWTQQPYEKDGIVHLRGGTFRKGFIGEHEIARIRLRATESGTAHVTAENIRFVAGDGKGTTVPLAEKNLDEVRIYVTNADGSLVGNATVQIITDIDGDGDVDFRDISAFMAAWRDLSMIFDFNGDGRMTFRDFGILLADSFFK